MNRGRLFAIIGGIFGLVGVVMLGVGVAWAVSTAAFQASAEQTDGTVVALTERTSTSTSSGRRSSAWYPTVEYAVDGRRYSFDSNVGANPPAYAQGDTVPVAYDPANPSDAQIATFWSAYLGPMIVGGLGIVFTPLGTVLFVMGRRLLRRREWLRTKGREVWAEIADVGVEFSVEINGRHPYVVHATWYDEGTGRTHVATSDPVRDDPGPGLRGRTHVRVLYDPADPDRNVLDLGSAR
jgi:uncharacterized protein DUF3592